MNRLAKDASEAFVVGFAVVLGQAAAMAVTVVAAGSLVAGGVRTVNAVKRQFTRKAVHDQLDSEEELLREEESLETNGTKGKRRKTVRREVKKEHEEEAA